MARPTRRSGNLPAEASSFIGRRREIAEVRKKLTEARLVSLVGPGGVGKTRLAIRAATDLGRGFRGGGWLVELAEVLDPALVSNALMAALDLRAQAAAEPPGPCAFLPGGKGTAAGRGQLRASARSSRTGRDRHDESCAGRAGDRHQPGAALGAG